MILCLLAGLIRCCLIKLDMIMRGMLRSEVSIPLVITCAEVTTMCMRDDVIIVNVCVVNSMWLVTVIERKASSHCVNEPSGSHVMASIALIGVV